MYEYILNLYPEFNVVSIVFSIIGFYTDQFGCRTVIFVTSRNSWSS